MVAKPINFSPENIYKGNKGEDVIAYILRNEGYYVVVTADLQERNNPGAPMARTNSNKLVLPDLDVAKGGYRGWCEVKSKSAPSYTRKTNRYEHGIGIRKFAYYWQIQEQYGCPVYLFVWEMNSGAVLYSSLLGLLADGLFRFYLGKKQDYGGMIFFARANFNLWGKVTLCNDGIYQQGNILDTLDAKGQGDKLFDFTRHQNGLL